MAFLTVPAAAAHLLTDRLGPMLVLSVIIGLASSTLGYFLALAIDASIAGCMAAVMGVLFLAVWLLAPREGIFGRMIRLRRTRRDFARALILSRLDRSPAAPDAVAADLACTRTEVNGVLDALMGKGLVAEEGGILRPTHAGLAFVRAVVD